MPRIKLFLNPVGLDRHWEAYPFRDKPISGVFLRMLHDRGIHLTDSQQADIHLYVLQRTAASTISQAVPTVLIEGRDVISPLNVTRQLLNQHPNAVLWKWGVFKRYEHYQKTEFVFGRSTQRRGIDFNPDQLVLAFNLCWHPYYSIHMFQNPRQPKLIDISFCGTVYENHCHKFKQDHRNQCIEAINRLPSSLSKVIVRGVLPVRDYCAILSRSKICVSPWGNGEISGRDVQGFAHACEVIRPRTREFANTWPDIWAEAVECKPDFSDLEERVTEILDTWDEKAVQARGRKWRNTIDNCGILADRVAKLLHQAVSVPGGS